MRERLKGFARIALRVYILLAVAFVSAVTTMRLAITGREVEVPRVVGLRAGDAQILLGTNQLGMRIADRVYSNLPKDSVVRQSPLPGMKVKTGQRTHVVLSLGPQRVTIPDVEGKNLRTARIELLRGGLQTGEITTAYLPDSEAGQVLLQNPRAGAKDSASPRVNMLVAREEPESAMVMPDLMGLSLTDAQKKISSGALRLVKITPTLSAYAPRGTVLGQLPERGARVLPGTSVEVQIVE